jgi:hypothetical protein
MRSRAGTVDVLLRGQQSGIVSASLRHLRSVEALSDELQADVSLERTKDGRRQQHPGGSVAGPAVFLMPERAWLCAPCRRVYSQECAQSVICVATPRRTRRTCVAGNGFVAFWLCALLHPIITRPNPVSESLPPPARHVVSESMMPAVCSVARLPLRSR